MKLAVVIVTNNIDEYPDNKEDTEKYPHLVKRIGDEQEIFIVDVNDPENFWKADEFFYETEIKRFTVTEGTL